MLDTWQWKACVRHRWQCVKLRGTCMWRACVSFWVRKCKQYFGGYLLLPNITKKSLRWLESERVWMVRRGTPLYTVNDNISTNSGLTETRDREQCFQFVQANLSPAPSLQRKGGSRLRVVAVTILDMTNKKWAGRESMRICVLTGCCSCWKKKPRSTQDFIVYVSAGQTLNSSSSEKADVL